MTSDGRHAAEIAVLERPPRPARDRVHDVVGRALRFLHRHLAHARQRFAVGAVQQRGITDNVHIIPARNRQVGVHEHSTAAIGRHAQRGADRRGDDARGPEHRFRLERLRAHPDDAGLDRGDSRARPHRDAKFLERATREARERRYVRRENIRPALNQNHPRSFRVNTAEIMGKGVPGDLRYSTCKLHASRPAADDDEGQEPALDGPITFSFGTFKSDQDLLPHFDGVFHRLEAGRVGRPFVVAEIRGLRTGRKNQVVVADFTVGELDDFALHVHGGGFRKPDIDVALPSQDPANGRRDVAR